MTNVPKIDLVIICCVNVCKKKKKKKKKIILLPFPTYHFEFCPTKISLTLYASKH